MGAGVAKVQTSPDGTVTPDQDPPGQERKLLTPERQNRLRAKVRTVAMLSSIKSTNSQLSVERQESRQAMLDFMRNQKRAITVAWNSIRDTHAKKAAMHAVPETGAARKVHHESSNITGVQLESETHCHLCGELAAFTGVSCRVCPLSYHPHCIEESGQIKEKDTLYINSDTGWSCYLCSDLGQLITADQLHDLQMDFNKMDINGDNHISWKEFRDYKNKENMRSKGHSLTPDDVTSLRAHFSHMDLDQDEHIDWKDYLRVEAGRILRLRSKKDLVKLLTPKEVDKARRRYTLIYSDEEDEEKEDAETRRKAWLSYLENQAHRILLERPNRCRMTFYENNI